ncbi:MAG: DUF6783 domain-containing protein [Ruminococcus sp.]
MCVTICGRFRSDEGAVAGYGNRVRAKYTAKWGVQMRGMIFKHALILFVHVGRQILKCIVCKHDYNIFSFCFRTSCNISLPL